MRESDEVLIHIIGDCGTTRSVRQLIMDLLEYERVRLADIYANTQRGETIFLSATAAFNSGLRLGMVMRAQEVVKRLVLEDPK